MIKEINCREAGMDCDFMMRSNDEVQMIKFVREHAKESHGTEMSSDDVRGLLRTI